MPVTEDRIVLIGGGGRLGVAAFGDSLRDCIPVQQDDAFAELLVKLNGVPESPISSGVALNFPGRQPPQDVRRSIAKIVRQTEPCCRQAD